MEKKIFTNTIYNEDCLNVLRRMPDNSVDAIVMDPPYQFTEKKTLTGFAKDKTSFEEIEFMSHGYDPAILDECLRVVKNVNITLFCSLKQLPMYFKYCEKKNIHCKIMIWGKTNPPPLCNGTYLSDTEYILHLSEGDKEAEFATDYYLTSTVKIAKTDPLYHPTTKPINILKDLIEAVSDEGDVILDPFMGSGSTAVACIETGRYFIGCEMEERYFNVCERKIDNALAENPEYTLTSCPLDGVDNETAALDAISDTIGDIDDGSVDMAYINLLDKNEIPYDLFDKLTCRWMKKPNMYLLVRDQQLIRLMPYFEDKGMSCNIITNLQNGKILSFLLFVRNKAYLWGTYHTKRKFFVDDRDLSLPNQDNIAYELMRRIITNSSKQGNTVFCYGGLGTCIEVCLRENRRFIAYDKDYSKILHYINTINTTDAADDELAAA